MIIPPTSPKSNIFDLAQVESQPVDNSRPVLAYLAGMSSKASRDVLKRTLDRIASIATGGACDDCYIFPWHLLKFEHTTALRAVFVESFAPATGNRFLSTLRGVLRSCWRVGYMTAEDFHRSADLRNIRGARLPAGREITQDELLAVLRAAWKDGTAEGYRDTAILAVLHGFGLRRDEVARLNLSDYDKDESGLKVRGKGNKERFVYSPNEIVDEVLNRWLEVRGDAPGPFFLPADSGHNVYFSCENLTNQAIYYIVKRRFSDIGITDVTPHDFRRTYVTTLLSAGQDIVLVSKLVGHESIQTTARYDRRPDAERRKVARSLPQPFKPAETDRPS